MNADFLKRLEDGIRAADANGETEGVQKLGAAYRQLQQQMAGASAPDQPANDGGLDRIVKNITHEFEATKADVPADVYTSLVSLKDNMNHPKTIRAERFAMLDASLATLFPQDAQSRDFWLKEFYPLASIGNDKPYKGPKKKKKNKKLPEKILGDLASV